jgi:hypothetical protein
MSEVEDTINLDPATIKNIEEKNGYIAIVFSQQPFYSISQDNNSTIPVYDCEIRIWGAKLELLNTEFPFEIQHWQLSFKGGSRYCFLPINFMADGPIKFVLGSDESPNAIITGTRVTLELGNQTGSLIIRAHQ